MVDYTRAAALLLLSTTLASGFSTRSESRSSSAYGLRPQLSASPVYLSEDGDEGIQNLRKDVDRFSADVTKVGTEYIESFSKALTEDEVDSYEAEMAQKEKIVLEQRRQYDVTLPLTQTLGLTLCQVDVGQDFSDYDLNLDSMVFQSPLAPSSEANDGEYLTMDPTEVKRRLDPNFKGIVVSSVVVGQLAWNNGIRPGDILISTSATLGDVSIGVVRTLVRSLHFF